jgi:hypothetical protein
MSLKDRCPECGKPVLDTVQGVALDSGERDAAADALRSYGKSFLYGLPLGFYAVGCIGPPIALVSLMGSLQRFIALRNVAAALPEEVATGSQALARARSVATAEMALGLPALVLLSISTAGVLGADAGRFVALAVSSLWFGTMALGIVAGWLFMDATIARLALPVARRSLVPVTVLATVPVMLVANVVAEADLSWSTSVSAPARILAALAWAAASGMLAFDGSSAGDEVAGGARRRPPLAVPTDEPTAPRPAARRRTPEDDAPIPLE